MQSLIRGTRQDMDCLDSYRLLTMNMLFFLNANKINLATSINEMLQIETANEMNVHSEIYHYGPFTHKVGRNLKGSSYTPIFLTFRKPSRLATSLGFSPKIAKLRHRTKSTYKDDMIVAFNQIFCI
jgi:hypothetical protein